MTHCDTMNTNITASRLRTPHILIFTNQSISVSHPKITFYIKILLFSKCKRFDTCHLLSWFLYFWVAGNTLSTNIIASRPTPRGFWFSPVDRSRSPFRKSIFIWKFWFLLSAEILSYVTFIIFFVFLRSWKTPPFNLIFTNFSTWADTHNWIND